MSKIILLMVLSLSFVFSSCKSSVKKNIDKDTKKKLEKKTKKKDDCKCSYDTYYGSIKIVRLQNKSGKYNISFKFISESEVKNEEHRKSLLNTFDTKNTIYIIVGIVLLIGFIIYQILN